MEHSMEHRRVGRSGLKVSAIGVGCNPFGIEVDAATAERIVDTALDHGVTYFDTADSYSRGVSEEIVGHALAGKRDKAVIGTKFGNRMGPEANDKGTSRKHIIKACEASLTRLRTDYIDLYQVHDPDRDTPIEETMRTLDDLVRQGKVRYVGCSNFFEWEACEAQWAAEKYGLNPFISCQDFYNLLYRDIEKRMEPFCIKYGLGMIPYFPLAGALLSGAFRRGQALNDTKRGIRPTFRTWDSERNWSVQEKLADFAEKRGWALPQMALAWLLTRPMMATTIAGVEKPEQLEANIKALDIRFSPEDLAEIDRITLVDDDRTRAPVYRLKDKS
jgi:aryl-alcohol dehydrogenase-like predicted oxidoreductase